MGGQESKPPPEYDSAMLVFSTEEQVHLKNIFASICGHHNVSLSAETAALGFGSEQLQAYAPTLPHHLSSQLFLYMLNVLPPVEQRSQTVSFYQYVTALSHVLKGTPAERAVLVGTLAGGGSDDVTRAQLIRLIEDLMVAYTNTDCDQGGYTSWTLTEQDGSMIAFINNLLRGLDAPGAGLDADRPYDASTLEKWISNCTLLIHVVDSVFQPCFLSVASADDDVTGATSSESSKLSLVPLASGAPWSKFSTLLDLPALILLTDSLPPACRSPWRFLFSDLVHGESFSTLLKQVLNKGPCVLLLRDTEGHVFGGFTGTNLSLKPQFAGNETSFLFRLQPSMQVFNVTRYNSNYLYLNRGQDTMPNGLGMGGQFDYWGLWLDADYGHGSSRAEPTCTTYGSPQLSACPSFTVNHLEVWGVGPDPALKQQQDGADGAPTSILDKDAGAKTLLEMINRPQHSEGLREPDTT